VLPISNPANLVIFDEHMPHLSAWLAQFGLPSVLSIGATYLTLRLAQRQGLRHEQIARDIERPALARAGRMTAVGILSVVMVLVLCSAFNVQLGLPTFICGGATAAMVLGFNHRSPWPLLRDISWGVLPLVAGLFVLVEGLNRTGLIAALSRALDEAVVASVTGAAWISGALVVLACNLMNNLPPGLIAGSVVATDGVPAQVTRAVLIGVDLGPNLSVAGSLATILWLVALRREGEDVSAWRFLRLGLLVTPPALALSILAAIGSFDLV
jgi:arsenical pump membrane protein